MSYPRRKTILDLDDSAGTLTTTATSHTYQPSRTRRAKIRFTGLVPRFFLSDQVAMGEDRRIPTWASVYNQFSPPRRIAV
jgi:hypothetical protein